MGNNPDRVPPFFFTKPAVSLVTNNATIPYPPRTGNLHHEVELVLAVGVPGDDISVESAPDRIWGYAAGVDLTRRDLQSAAKDMRQPWDMAKGFDHSAPVGDIVPAEQISHLSSAKISLRVNGTVRQSANINEMIWSPAEIMAELSTYVRLMPGDIIFTGTPAGVGAIQKGDVIEAEIEGLPLLSIQISK